MKLFETTHSSHTSAIAPIQNHAAPFQNNMQSAFLLNCQHSAIKLGGEILPKRRSGVTNPEDALLLAAIRTCHASAFRSYHSLVMSLDLLRHENLLVSFEHRGLITGLAADVSATSASGMLSAVRRSMVQMAQVDHMFGKSCMLKMMRRLEVLSYGYGGLGFGV